MPKRPKKRCAYPGCWIVTDGKYCDKHHDVDKVERRKRDEGRISAAQRGYDARWRKARKWFLSRNPLCVQCLEDGRLTPATVVDHVVPHRGDVNLFWDVNNWQALCKSCHDRKTAKEDGGFGNPSGSS